MITASSIPDHRKTGFIGDVHSDEDDVREDTVDTVKAREKRGVSLFSYPLPRILTVFVFIWISTARLLLELNI